MISKSDFDKVDIRVGRIVELKDFPEGKYSTHVLTIDLGSEIGIKTSLARLKPHYSVEIKDKLVLCVVNFPPKQIGSHTSEVLTLGVPDAEGNCVLIMPEREVPLGGKLF